MCYSLDPYNTGTPKYSTAQEIYEGLQTLAQGEEIGFIAQFAPDVSWEGQDYTYQDQGGKLLEQFERLSGYGEKLWIMDLALSQVDSNNAACEIHDLVYEALHNSGLAKRVSFKRLFCDIMLGGNTRQYAEIAQAYADELGGLSRFGYLENMLAFTKVMVTRGTPVILSPYQKFSRALFEKVCNLKLPEETKVIIQCRSLLTAYDDFIFGIRVNQALYDEQQHFWEQKAARLQAAYEKKLAGLWAVAERHGLLPEMGAEIRLLEEGAERDISLEDLGDD